MELHESFEVAAPRESVWALFLDVPSVARCLPGATLTEELGDGRYAGRLTVKLGPMGFGFDGEALVGSDATTWSGTIDGRGTDRRGGSRGGVQVRWALLEREGGGTRVTLDADVTLSGPAAQFGRTGILLEVSRRLLQQFAACLEARLAPDGTDVTATGTADVRVGSLLLDAVRARVTGRSRPPGPPDDASPGDA